MKQPQTRLDDYLETQMEILPISVVTMAQLFVAKQVNL